MSNKTVGQQKFYQVCLTLGKRYLQIWRNTRKKQEIKLMIMGNEAGKQAFFF